jgi:hypothetical protein
LVEAVTSRGARSERDYFFFVAGFLVVAFLPASFAMPFS